MAKKKGRSARKEHRQRAEKARERGLPEATPIQAPLRIARPVSDVEQMALQADSAGGSRRRRGARHANTKGFPTALKVGIVALLILGVFYFVSQQRKETRAEGAATGSTENDRSLEDPLDLEPSDSTVLSPIEKTPIEEAPIEEAPTEDSGRAMSAEGDRGLEHSVAAPHPEPRAADSAPPAARAPAKAPAALSAPASSPQLPSRPSPSSEGALPQPSGPAVAPPAVAPSTSAAPSSAAPSSAAPSSAAPSSAALGATSE